MRFTKAGVNWPSDWTHNSPHVMNVVNSLELIRMIEYCLTDFVNEPSAIRLIIIEAINLQPAVFL
jgi:hypothetical protein